ncbi:HAD family hydrolase [Acidisoma sp. L85]|uniref:HAD-IIIC family phosphatase n=1 Tax=Acidisoma sp. L85 TaxID=1641850 RepID=UPI00131DFBC8|nr:HAD-IIIC family phosphatase [Acidisoma sp. L85]
MANAPQLHWLPIESEVRRGIKMLATASDPLKAAIALANTRLDFLSTNALDDIVRRVCDVEHLGEIGTRPVRLAILGSSTLSHLHAAIRVAALRRSIWITTYETAYGQYLQELMDPDSGLHQFNPTTILFSFDAHHVARNVDRALSSQDAEATLNSALDRIRHCWALARRSFQCTILQQTVLNSLPTLLGSNEHRLPDSRRYMVEKLNFALRLQADEMGVDLMALDAHVHKDGVLAWHDPALWHRSKQDVAPPAAPLYGDLVARLIAAQQGRSAKCLVLDLDDTIWGGTIGEDGLDGIVVGQGSPLGEGFAAVQAYAQSLKRRGVILAVCSKNDEMTAAIPFEKHPEMLLRREDVACFCVNWNDKASNLRHVARELNIGLESLVFVDDSPFERALVRQELPMVAVPEVPSDPALVPQTLADAGYFESLAVTDEDRSRAGQYQANTVRSLLADTSTDLDSYLQSLEMELRWKHFDRIGLERVVQLINKTNQFNLTTLRYTREDVMAVMEDSSAFGLQLRLIDRFGDNGIIAIIIGRLQGDKDVLIDTWLMSCRVLGRGVEQSTLKLIVDHARALGAKRLVGDFRPTSKNKMVEDLYPRLGFDIVATYDDGCCIGVLDLGVSVLANPLIKTREI